MFCGMWHRGQNSLPKHCSTLKDPLSPHLLSVMVSNLTSLSKIKLYIADCLLKIDTILRLTRPFCRKMLELILIYFQHVVKNHGSHPLHVCCCGFAILFFLVNVDSTITFWQPPSVKLATVAKRHSKLRPGRSKSEYSCNTAVIQLYPARVTRDAANNKKRRSRGGSD